MTAVLPAERVLRTSRYLLRRIAARDANALYGTLNCPGFTDGLLQDPPRNLEAAAQLIDDYLLARNAGSRCAFAITEGDEFRGLINLFQREPHGLWSVGFWITQQNWGRGIATEAARVVINLAFADLNADVVHAAHVHWNMQSARVLNELGMKFTHRREQGIRKNAEWVPNLHYEVTRADWQAHWLQNPNRI